MVTLDARTGPQSRFVAGALRADLSRDLCEPRDVAQYGRHPLPSIEAWCRTVGTWGITPDTDVIVFDDQAGGLAAARCWWMLRAIGHERVQVVDMSALAAVLVDEPAPPPGGPPYAAVPHWLLPTATDDDVVSALASPHCRVVDARAAERFAGRTEPLDPVAGHIPGAVNLPWLEHIDLAAFERRADRLLANVAASDTIVHCGSGVTACHTLLQLHRLGRPLPALYVGSWSAWCRQGRPIARDAGTTDGAEH